MNNKILAGAAFLLAATALYPPVYDRRYSSHVWLWDVGGVWRLNVSQLVLTWFIIMAVAVGLLALQKTRRRPRIIDATPANECPTKSAA